MKRRFPGLFFALISTLPVFSQPGNLYLQRDMESFLSGGIMDTAFNTHASVKPYLMQEVQSALGQHENDSIVMIDVPGNYWMSRDLIRISKGKFHLKLNPVIQAMAGYGTANDSTDTAYELGGGLALEGSLGKQFAFGMDYTTYRSTYTDYVQQYIDRHAVIPGSGFAFYEGEAVISSIYSGYLSWQPDEALNLQVGIGKQFIGQGYRSLLLSDNGFVYPYGRIQVNIWKIKYQVLYSGYRDFSNPGSTAFVTPEKYCTSNYLSMNIGKHANIGLFQAVIWQGKDSLNNRGFDVNYLNPVIFTRPVEYSVGSPDNALLGLDFSYKIFKKNIFYSQLVLDEFLLDSLRSGNGWWANKYGYQLGFKFYDPFGLKGIMVQLERNEVRPYTYAHTEVQQNYGHYNQPLAHTLGANFIEYHLRFSYHRDRWLFQLNGMQAEQGNDYGGVNYGANIYRSNSEVKSVSGNFTTQGNLTRIHFLEFRTSYLINPAWKLMFDVGYTYRSSEPQYGFSAYSNMVHVGLRTGLYNIYRDF